MKPYNALDVAKYILNVCKDNDYRMTNLRLQKILYFIQAEFLVTHNRPCFQQDIEAWSSGPTIPIVYREYKTYGTLNIVYFHKKKNTPTITAKDMRCMQKIIDACEPYNNVDLTNITLNQQPWLSTIRSSLPNKVISTKKIYDFFNT